MAATAITDYGPKLGVDLQDYWKRIAANKLGLNPSQMSWYFYNAATMHSQAALVTTFGTGNNTLVTSGGMGFTTAGIITSGRLHECGGTLNVAIAPMLQPATTDKWWVGGRVAFTTAIGANTKGGIGGRSGATTANTNNTDEFMLGVKGSGSTTNFGLAGAAGAFIDSGVAIDTATHDFQGWRDGVNSYVQVDANPAVTGTARPSASCAFGGYLYEADATLRTMTAFWWAAAVPRV